ncbi:MAG: hypothetical protein E7048_09445 [Lentisphaerae bacterium]|nr:hypothetical protein [Lentisphaerota bacterium]
MKKTVLFLACFSALILAGAEINLINNPEFKGYDDCLEGWNHNPMVFNGYIKRLPGAGPDKRTAVRIDFSRYHNLKQSGIKLVAGEKYRIGGWVRTKNFKSPFRVCGFVVSNQGWYTAAYSARFPVDTKGKWVKWERIVTMPKSSNGEYSFLIYGYQSTGVFELCNPFLIPLSEKGRKESRPMQDWRDQLKRVSPYYPLLSKVSAATGEIGFAVSSPVGADFTEYSCRVSYAPGTSKKYSAPKDFAFNRHGMAKTFLGKIPVGKGSVKAQLVHKKSGKVLYGNEYAVNAVTPLTAKGKWLNNFVFEIINAPLRTGKVQFTAADAGWYRVAFSRALPDVSASLDGKEIVKYRKGEASETMRYIERGEHSVVITGKGKIPAGTKLIVARVPETPYYPLFPSKAVEKKRGMNFYEGFFKYDIDFCRKYLWHNFNTCFSQGAFPLRSKADHALKAEMKDRGMVIFGCNGFPKAWWSMPAKMEENIRNTLHVKNGDGRTLDEAFPNSPIEIQLGLVDLGWNMQNYEKLVYLWQGVYTDKYFDYPAIHLPLIASMSNISQGRGKLLLETYARVTPTEKLMVEQLKRYPRQLEEVRYIPQAAERFIYFLGGYCLPGVYNTNCYPESDVKYFWDRYFHLLATHPACRGVGGVGGYSLRNSDEEMLRFFAALVRHYCIEGKTTLFSSQYGYKLNPGHLKDGDFREEFKYWKACAASENSLKAHKISGYGKNFQGRQSRDIASVGDTCALFTATGNKANILSQKITGLQKGKLYSIVFTTADPEDIAKPKLKRLPFVFKSELKGVKIIPEYSYDIRVPERWDKKNIKRKSRDIHTRKIVFKAEKETAEIIFSDAGAPAGQKRVLNFVSVRPYFGCEK